MSHPVSASTTALPGLRSLRPLGTWRLAWVWLWSRPWATVLHVLVMALGLSAMGFVWQASQRLEAAFQRDLAGIDAVVGAKGSPMQLILSGVFHIDAPTGNVRLADLQAVREHPQVAQVIPLSLGDNLAGFRIVGTTPDYLGLYGARVAQGALWSQPMQAVLGAQAAAATGLVPGAAFAGAHGLGQGGATHGEVPYTVSGVLAPCGCVLDRLVLTATESVWQVHDGMHGLGDPSALSAEERQALDEEREVTVALVRYSTPLAALTFPRWVNGGTAMQAAAPALEVARLFRLLGVGVDVLRGFGVVLMLVASASVLLALWTAVRERQGDLAMLRMLGLPPWRLAGLLLAEAIWLAMLAAAVGVLLAQGLTALVGWAMAQQHMALWTPGGVAQGVMDALSGLGPLPLWALVCAVLAALPAAWRAGRLDVAELLLRR